MFVRFAESSTLIRILCFAVASLLIAQISLGQAVQDKPAQQPQKKKDEVEIPAPSKVTLTTTDNVNLVCTFFGAPQDKNGGTGKEAIPFILVHDWEGNRNDLLPFAAHLQSLGCAVIVPDLRGHGESVNLIGATQKIDPSKFRRQEFASVLFDLERCKKYLVEKNDEGELNIELLSIVAVGKSAIFAVQWAISDWSWPDIAGIKQGRDVKSVTLIAPVKKFKSLSLNPLIKHELFSGRSGLNLPTLVVWGANDEVAGDCQAIYDLMAKGRPDPEEIEDPKEKIEKTTLIKAEIPGSRLTGTQLIRDNQVKGLWNYLAEFVAVKVGSKKADFPWKTRKRE